MNDHSDSQLATSCAEMSDKENTAIMRRLNFFVSGIILAGTAMFALFAVQVVIWFADNKPPFEMLAYNVQSAEPGNFATVNAKVQRQLRRNCSVAYTRFFFDSNNTRFDITPGVQHMNADAINELDRRTPGEVRFSFRVPREAFRGKATVVTSLEYTCNPIHRVWPIQMLMKNEMEVL